MRSTDETEKDGGIYADTGTSGQQPTTDVSAPGAGGVKSREAAGGLKRDPLSADSVVGHTIAGRTGGPSPQDSTIEADDSHARIGGAPQHITPDHQR